MVSVITFFVYLSTYYFTTIQNMQTDNERYKKMASLAQIGWWEVDLTAGYYLCSDYLSDLLGLDGDTISTSDFLNLIREDYRKQIAQEFRANSSIHKDFYEQTFPIHSKYGEVCTMAATFLISPNIPRISKSANIGKPKRWLYCLAVKQY